MLNYFQMERRKYGRETQTVVHTFPTDTSFSPGAIKMIAEIASHRLAPFKEIKEREQKYIDMFDRARKEEKKLRLTQPSFSLEQREMLDEMGYDIVRLYGKTAKEICDLDNWFSDTLLQDKPDILNEKSFQGEVAIPETATFLRPQRSRKYKDLKTGILAFNRNISKKIPGAKAIVGSLSDYLELDHVYQRRNFGKRWIWLNGVITSTKVGKNGVAAIEVVGILKSAAILKVLDKRNPLRDSSPEIAPIIIPTKIGWNGQDYQIY